jgi:hypothetical protein
MLFFLFAAALRLPPELHHGTAPSPPHAIVALTSPSRSRRLRISTRLSSFLTSHSQEPLQLIFSRFENFLQTPVKLGAYDPPDLDMQTLGRLELVPPVPSHQMPYTIKLCWFVNCRTDASGGAVNTVIPLRLCSCHFASCLASQDGGALRAELSSAAPTVQIPGRV